MAGGILPLKTATERLPSLFNASDNPNVDANWSTPGLRDTVIKILLTDLILLVNCLIGESLFIFLFLHVVIN